MSFVLQQVRELSRKQFFLRALIQKCREKAGLPPMAWTPISLLRGWHNRWTNQGVTSLLDFIGLLVVTVSQGDFGERHHFDFSYTARFYLWMFAIQKELFFSNLCSSEMRLLYMCIILIYWSLYDGKLNGKTWL